MLIEFTGCSGAGKTSLGFALAERLTREGYSLRFNHLFGKRYESLSNLVWDLRSLPVVAFFRGRYAPFLSLALDHIRCRKSFLTALNCCRSIIRKTGTFERMREACRGRVIGLVDEGTVHAAHNIFVSGHTGHIDEKDVRAFAQVVPLPDIVVCVRASYDVLFSRTRKRVDPPRRFKDDRALSIFLDEAQRLFDCLMTVPRIAERTIVVNGENPKEASVEQLIQRIISITPSY